MYQLLTDDLIRILREKIRVLKSEAIWVLMGQIGLALGVILGVKILTHVLTPSEFGRLNLANTISLFVGTNLFGPLGQGLMRYWSISFEKGEINQFIHLSKRYIGLLVGIVFIANFVFSGGIFYGFGLKWGIILFIAVGVGIVMGWMQIRILVLMAARKRKLAAIINFCVAILKPLIGALLAVVIVRDAASVVSGYFLAIILVIGCTEYYYRQMISHGGETALDRHVNHRLGRDILAFSWPFFVWGIFGWVQEFCDRWALQAFHGADVVGAFSVITQMASYPLIFGTNFLNYLFIPIAYDRAGSMESVSALKSAQRIILSMLGLYIVGALLLVLVYAFSHRYLVLLISNADYVVFSHLLPGLTLSWAFFYLGQLLAGFGFVANKPSVYIFPKLISGLTAAGLTFYGSKWFGPVGVVWGLLASGMLYAIWNVVIAYRLPERHCHPEDAVT